MRHSILLIILVVCAARLAAQAPPAELSERRQRALAAILAPRNGDRHDLLGGHELPAESTANAKTSLFETRESEPVKSCLMSSEDCASKACRGEIHRVGCFLPVVHLFNLPFDLGEF